MPPQSLHDEATALVNAFASQRGDIHLFCPDAGHAVQSRDPNELAEFLAMHPDASVDLVTSSGDAIGLKLYGFGAPRWRRGVSTVERGAFIFLFEKEVALSGCPQGVHGVLLEDFWEARTRSHFRLSEIYSHQALSPGKVRISLGNSANQRPGSWAARDFSWLDLALKLQGQGRRREKTTDFLQGEAAGGTRKAVSMIANSILAVEFSSVQSIEEIRTKIMDRGLEAVLYTAHDHMSTTTEVNRDRFWKWANSQDTNVEQLIAYLETVEGLSPDLVKDARILDEGRHTKDGVMIVVEHDPVPRYQAVFPLKESFVFAKQARTQKEAILEWKKRFAGFCVEMGFRCREVDADPARSFRLPAREEGTQVGAWWIAGEPLNFLASPRSKPQASRVSLKERKAAEDAVPRIHGGPAAGTAFSAQSEAFEGDSDATKPGGPRSAQAAIVENDLASRDPDEAKHLRELNDQSALVVHGGKLRVLYEPKNAADEPKLLSVPDARVREAPRTFLREKPDGKGFEKIVPFELWLKWPYRREYEGLVFEPGRSNAQYYNQFRGWTIEPEPGDWSILRDHLLHVFCGADSELFEWLMTWLAHLFQHPGEKPGSAIVVRGSKGCGKSIVFDILARLLGSTFSKAADTRKLLGNFNAALDHNLLFLLEESHWSGDKAQEGVLKDLITSPYIAIEKKGIDSELKPNFSRVAILSNERWIIPATFDERRYAIFDCSDDRRGDQDHFRQMIRQMNDEGGLAAMLHELLNFEPTDGWDILRRPPETLGLRQQIEESLQGIDQFMFELLKFGCFESVECEEDSIEFYDDRPNRVSAKSMRAALDEFLKNNEAGRKRRPGYDVIDRAFREWTGGLSEMEALPGMQNRTRILTLPPLNEARSHAERSKGVRFDALDCNVSG